MKYVRSRRSRTFFAFSLISTCFDALLSWSSFPLPEGRWLYWFREHTGWSTSPPSLETLSEGARCLFLTFPELYSIKRIRCSCGPSHLMISSVSSDVLPSSAASLIMSCPPTFLWSFPRASNSNHERLTLFGDIRFYEDEFVLLQMLLPHIQLDSDCLYH